MPACGASFGFVRLASAALLCAAAAARAQAPEPPPVQPPEVVQRTDAAYPPAALAARLEATVWLLVTVGLDGTVTDAAVAESGGEAFDRAALEAVKQWRFIPARRGAELVVSRIRIPFRFALPPVEAVAVPVPAAPPDAGTPPTGEDDEGLDVTVRGRRRPPSRGTSDFQLDVGGLAAVPRQNSSEMLKLAPGILLTNEGGDAHAEQVFLRGFDAREGQDIEFSAGGVPINEAGNLHGNGYADTHFIIPELVTSLRVLEGPFDPRQGNFGVAGSAEYELGLSKKGLTAKASAGSFGTARALVLWGPPGGSDATFAGAELYRTSGFGANRDGQRASVMAHYEGRLGADTFRVGATAYGASSHSAGVIREDDFAAGRIGFFDTYDTGQGEDTSRYSLSAELESRAGRLRFHTQVFGVLRPMRLRENFTGFLLDPQEPWQPAHPQRGDLIDLSVLETTLGARGSAHLSGTWRDLPQELEVGYFARGDLASATQYRLEAATGHPYHLDTDLDARLADIGAYLDLDLKPLRWLSVRGGLRAELLTYDVLDRCAVSQVAHPSRTNPPGDLSCLSQQDFGNYREPVQRASTFGSAYLPRASVVVGPFAGFEASAAFGRGIRSIDPIYVSQDARTPFAAAQSLEVGAQYGRRLGGVDLSARSTVFQTRVDQDLIFSEIAGRNVLGGPTTRTGVAGALRATSKRFDVATNLTYVRAVFEDTGYLIPYIPDVVFRLDGSTFGDLPFFGLRGTFATGVTYVAPRPLPQSERGNAVFTVDVNGTLSWGAVEVGLSCTNLLDARYRLGEYNFVSDFRSEGTLPTLVPVRHFSAGAPRSLLLTVGFNLGGTR